ncbi:MAG: hypothetical protein U9N52_00705 [Campylobacterota bacterium]|nr:hypothetical protein [Campylobacterota bacterium]
MGFLTFFSDKKKQIDTSSQAHLALQEYADTHQLLLYRSIPIFHRHERQKIAVLLFDTHRGIYLFDSVGWKMQEIKDATATPAAPNKKDKADVKVDAIHKFIHNKFNEVLHVEGCELVNILILEHLTQEDFEQLDESFHTLMPKKRLIFADDTPEEISQKLQEILPKLDQPLSASVLLGALFFHLNIMPDNLHNQNALLTQEQSQFIQSELANFSTLSGNYGTGKSSLILLKSIYELLNHPEYKILIIMPTLAVCDMLKKQLLDIIEYAIIDIDLLSIQILTPQQMISQHYQKLYKNESFSFAKITPKMFSHQYHNIDIVFCDDSYLIDEEFIRYLTQQQAKKKLCLVTHEPNANSYNLTHSFRSPQSFIKLCEGAPLEQNTKVLSYVGNPFMYIMLILREYFKDIDYTQLLIAVPHSQFALKLLDEINSFYGTIAHIYHADEGLLNQDLEKILIATHHELSHLQRENVIVIRDKHSDEKQICHAIGRASKRLFIISSDLKDETYEQDNKN